MKLAGAMVVLLASVSSSLAGQCYQNEEDPKQTITVNDPGTDPEWVWHRDGKDIETSTASSGTGVARRYATTADGKSVGYAFVGDVALVVDYEVYWKGCK